MGTNDLNRFPERPGMKQALMALKAQRRKPTEADRPPPSLFPMTPAAREARRLSRGEDS